MPPPVPAAEPQEGEAEAVAAAPRPGVPIALVLGGGALLLLLAVAMVVVLVIKSRQGSASPTPSPVVTQATPKPTPTPSAISTPAAAVEGVLRVETTPAGATVTVDGVVRGTSPVDVTGLALGPHEVKVEQKGFAPGVENVVLSAEAPSAKLSLPLLKTAPPVGTMELTSNPPGAVIKIDGVPVGRTPLHSYRAKLGRHEVEMAIDGYEPWKREVTLREGRKERVDGFLRVIPKATPVPTPPPDTVDPRRVYGENEVDTKPVRLSGQNPAYPKKAPKLKGDKGDLVVPFTVVVSEGGDVAEVKITQSGGDLVDEAIVAAVRTWRFTPGVKKGTKVKVRMSFRQTFRSG